jgi:glyoxylase-like metal-dependent hydrolase (beta-lactamase superfamily II)
MNTVRRRWSLVAPSIAIAVGLVASADRVYTQAGANRIWAPRLIEPATGEVQVLPVQGNIHMIVGAGGNITVQVAEEGILLVDTGIASMSEKVWAAVQTLSHRPMRYIINTTEYPDHTGGNAAIAPKGETVPLRDTNYTAGPQGTINYRRASVVSHVNVLRRMSAPTGEKAPTPEAAWPDNTYSISQKRFYFNNEPVVVMHYPSTNDGNSVVFFRKSDVVSAGDLLDLTRYPMIDVRNGGSIEGIIESLNHLIDITVPAAHGAGGTMVVPGHGRIADHAEVAYYRDMVFIIRDRIREMMQRGMTLEQIKKARPTRDYDARYGSTTGPWTTDMFVEAAYRTVSK